MRMRTQYQIQFVRQTASPLPFPKNADSLDSGRALVNCCFDLNKADHSQAPWSKCLLAGRWTMGDNENYYYPWGM